MFSWFKGIVKICAALYSDLFPLSGCLCWLAPLETCLRWWSKGVFPLISAQPGVLQFSWTTSYFQLHQRKCYWGQRSCNTNIVLYKILLLIFRSYPFTPCLFSHVSLNLSQCSGISLSFPALRLSCSHSPDPAEGFALELTSHGPQGTPAEHHPKHVL